MKVYYVLQLRLADLITGCGGLQPGSPFDFLWCSEQYRLHFSFLFLSLWHSHKCLKGLKFFFFFLKAFTIISSILRSSVLLASVDLLDFPSCGMHLHLADMIISHMSTCHCLADLFWVCDSIFQLFNLLHVFFIGKQLFESECIELY